MNLWRTPSWNRIFLFGAIAGIVLLLLPHLHAEQTGTFGVLNPPSAPQVDYTDTNDDAGNNKTYTAEGWIAFAQTQSGDGPTTCQAPALNYVHYAEHNYQQWITSDASYSVEAVSIPVEWALYQPIWDSGSPNDDACYKQFLTDIIGAYVAANYKIALTLSINHGPNWLAAPALCPNCQFVGQDNVTPPANGGAGGPSGTVMYYYIANIVFDQQVRDLAGAFIDSALAFADNAVSTASGGATTQVDLVRIGISENGETRYPLAFNCAKSYDLEWWAFDNAAQSPVSANARPIQIPNPGGDDCLFGWYPSKGDPSNSRPTTCSIPSGLTTEQATLDWWSWYFNALADAHAFLYHRFRKDGFTGVIAFVTPGAGTDPASLFTYLSDFWTGDESTYEADDPNETVNAGSAWFILYDQIIYSLQNVWSLPNVGTMWVDHSSVSANSNPATEDDITMNPLAVCANSDVGAGGVAITPAPSSSTNFQMPSASYTTSLPTEFPNWSTVRKMRVYASLEGNLPLMGENPGNNPGTGQYSTTTGYVTGMNDVIKLYDNCGLHELLWAFDGELNAGGGDDAIILATPTITPETKTAPPQCSGGGGGHQPYSGSDATIKGYCGYITNGGACPSP